MSFHFVSHLWEVQHLRNGTLVVLTQRDLDSTHIHDMVDELYEIVRENGQPNLFLDLAQVRYLTSMVIGKFIALDSMLRQIGGRVILQNLDPQHYETLQAANATEILDIPTNEFQSV